MQTFSHYPSQLYCFISKCRCGEAHVMVTNKKHVNYFFLHPHPFAKIERPEKILKKKPKEFTC